MLKAFEKKISKHLIPNNWFTYTMLVASIILFIPLFMFFQTNISHFDASNIIIFITIIGCQLLGFYIAYRHIQYKNNLPDWLIKTTFIGAGFWLVMAIIANALLVSIPFLSEAGNYQVMISVDYIYIFWFVLPLAFSFRKPKNKGKLVKYGKNRYRIVY